MAIDLAFDFFIDEPQMAFFRREASERLSAGDKVILVTHRPSWLFHQIGDDQLRSPMARTNLHQFEDDIIHAHRLQMPLVLAGDIHHYNRYASADGGHQRITAGAGAAFLYPTNHLAQSFNWLEPEGSSPTTRRPCTPTPARHGSCAGERSSPPSRTRASSSSSAGCTWCSRCWSASR